MLPPGPGAGREHRETGGWRCPSRCSISIPNSAAAGSRRPLSRIRFEDSLLRRFLANWTDSIEAHAAPLGGRVLRRDNLDLATVDLGRPSFGGNVATLLAPLFAEDAAEIAGVLADFYGFSTRTGTGTGTGTVFLFSAWPTPDLRPHGWTLLGYEPLMLRPAGGSPPAPPPGLRIEEVRDEAALRAFELAVVRGFESEDLAAQGPGAVFGAAVLADDRCRLWVGWADGQPVCGAFSFVAAGITNVTIVAIVPAARRRGHGAAVTWQATLAEPTLPALLLATDDGRPVYERMGFLPLFRFAVWSRDRPGVGEGQNEVAGTDEPRAER